VTPATTWSEGLLSVLNLSPLSDSHIAFEACFDGNSGTPDTPAGMQVYYAASASTVQEVSWIEGDKGWTIGKAFTANGHAGLGCYTWSTTLTVRYIMYIDLNNDLRMMWKDLDTTVVSTPTHPTGVWTNATAVSVPGVHPHSPIGYNNYLVVQMPDLYLVGYNVSFDAENSVLTSAQLPIQQKPIAGTHVWLWNLPSSGDTQLSLFDQLNGADITLTTFDMTTGQNVSTAAMQIPDG
jgi:hypothetical protein